MGLITTRDGASEYDTVALPRVGEVASREVASRLFLHQSARPTRRAVLHLHDLRGSFAPADLARWYNERGFHFYVTDPQEPIAPGPPNPRWSRTPRLARPGLMAMDAARRYLREAGGIDAMILSAEGQAARIAAQWCDARRAVRPVDALILSDPDFGRARRARLDIDCPVLVISVASDGQPDIRLGQHVTWLEVGEDRAGVAAPDMADARRRFFDEIGRWLGAYMYGQVRDQLL